MYDRFRDLCEKWLRLPAQPEPPPGDEETAIVFRAAPKYLNYLRILWAIRSGVGLLWLLIVCGIVATAIVSASRNAGHGHAPPRALMLEGAVLGFVGLVAILNAVVKLAVLQLDYEKRWYVVTDRSLRIREGVMTVREITFTFANIQNISVTQGPVQRWLGIADLKVETAGGGGIQAAARNGRQVTLNLHVAYFRGIDNADVVRKIIAERMRGHSDAGLGDHDDPPANLPFPSSPPPLPATGINFEEALQDVLKEAQRLREAAEARGR